MPEDFLEGLEPFKGEEGPGEGSASAGAGDVAKLTITLSYPHVLPLLRKCSVEATRKTVRKRGAAVVGQRAGASLCFTHDVVGWVLKETTGP
jgi:hypothetical protein